MTEPCTSRRVLRPLLQDPTLRAGWPTYLLAIAIYTVAEGAAFALVAPLLTDLLAGRTADAAWWLLPMTGVVALGWVAQYIAGLRALTIASDTRLRLYHRIETQLLRLPLGWFDAARTGQVPRMIGVDVQRVAGLAFLAETLLGAVLTPLTVLIGLLLADWRIACAAAICVPVVLVVLAAGRRLSDRVEGAHDATAAATTERLVEFAAGQPVLRATRSLEPGLRVLHHALDSQRRAARRDVLGAMPTQYLGQLAVQLSFTAVVITGLALRDAGLLGTARMIALAVVGISLLKPLGLVAGASTALRAARASAGRVGELLATRPLPQAAHPRHPADVSVSLAGVGFGYRPNEPVLDGLDLDLARGTTTALVGPSGAGKTTVAKIIARFHDVDTGAVRIGGVDVREIAADDLASMITIVGQDPYLFDQTIEDNIRAGDPTVKDARVRSAARRAKVDEIVARLPQGWASRVGEGGRLLSGGERQRVAIARALCKDAPIVLMDEITSSLDAENEAAISGAVRELAHDRTVLVIAHRLSTITHANRIAVLDGGRIVESGTHRELVRAGGRYAGFWQERKRAAGWRIQRNHPIDTP